MSRTLFTVAFIADCDEDARSELLHRMEHQWALNMLATLDRHDADFEDLTAAGFEFYGIAVSPLRERV